MNYKQLVWLLIAILGGLSALFMIYTLVYEDWSFAIGFPLIMLGLSVAVCWLAIVLFIKLKKSS